MFTLAGMFIATVLLQLFAGIWTKGANRRDHMFWVCQLHFKTWNSDPRDKKGQRHVYQGTDFILQAEFVSILAN